MGPPSNVERDEREREPDGLLAASPFSSHQPDLAPVASVSNESTQTFSDETSDPESLQPSSEDGPARARPWRIVPLPVQRASSITVRWLQGPRPPQIQQIRPFLPRIQSAPLWVVRRFLPKRKHRFVALLAFFFCWLLAFVTVEHHSAFSGDIAGYGNPLPISCGATYWVEGNGCGLDGNGCRPFTNQSFAFRCPGNCISEQVLNPRAVGAQELIYQPLVVGGPPTDDADVGSSTVYRGDSFLCSAAIHAGVVSNQDGGCAVVQLVGERDSYASTKRNGIQSVAFDSSFPLSFSFAPGTSSECKDLRWPLLAVSVIFTSLLSLFTTAPAVFFFATFVGIFYHVGLASDPPSFGDYYSLVSILLGQFLPAAFIAFVICRYVVRRALLGLRAQVEKTVLWLGGCWVGALTNYTFDFIPIQRLTPHDLDQQPGAKVALVVIVVVVLAIVVGQGWYLRLEGRLPRFLALYASMGIALGLLAAIPGLSLRIHHYILALLLLPGTSLQTRPSLLYQGLLVGLFINGIARWGFDSILQTPAALQGDGQYDSALPVISPPTITGSNITISWAQPSTFSNANGSFDGVSVLVNDVERYEGYTDAGDPPQLTWSRTGLDDRKPYYFRLAYLQATQALDYTRAGIWFGNGSWSMMPDGPSK
ncbi:MAG: hypothetical protein M1838_000575 [Thelocarpon superellum]|nr:MAG: hypothetical protein M1838_000575 [Thelocarpon superellum]